MDKDDRFVYLMRAGEDHYKVGIAHDALKRLKDLQTANPVLIELVAAVYIPRAQELEKKLHKWLENNKLTGGREWFKLEPQEALDLVMRMTRASLSSDITRYFDMANLAVRVRRLENILDVSNAESRAKDKELATMKREKKEEEKMGLDPFYDEAVHITIRAGYGSTSMLQRRLNIGYARAARLIDQLENGRIVGPADGARKRALLVET